MNKNSKTRTVNDTSSKVVRRATMSGSHTTLDQEGFNRHLALDHVRNPENANAREQFEAMARTIRDMLVGQWLRTDSGYERDNPKRVYYLSLEFLIGRSATNNLINLDLYRNVQESLGRSNQDWLDMLETEPDAGLGNGGLGRLAACFVESMATLQIPAMGYGLKYDYGIFRQEVENGFQVEQPDHWLAHGDPWEIARPEEAVKIRLGCSFRLEGGIFRAAPGAPMHLIGMPYDRPIVGYGGQTINTLRLWRANAPEEFGFNEFSSGDFVGAIVDRIVAETVTRVLYPDDSTIAGQVLRFVQQYFMVCCSLADITARFRRRNSQWKELPDKVAIQMNDTHPSLAVAELMRILLDQENMEWDQAWDITVRTLAYTNHTLLPEALERWPVTFFELICPRHLEIIYEINRRLLEAVRLQFPNDEDRVRKMSLIEESNPRQIRMANLAIVGSHSTNGVAKIHSELLRTQVVTNFADMFPSRFNNKTNGVTPRRWLLAANPALADLITASIGNGWITDLMELQRLKPLAEDSGFRERFLQTKREAKLRFASWLQNTTGQQIDPESIFDCQIKRIHEYKRQLLNILQVIVMYNRLRTNPELKVPSRTFLFAGKAAPAYHFAKLVIKLINNVGKVVNADPLVDGRIKVIFIPNYNVSLAERLIPAADVSEQISTAGYEASGTGNMKFMMNGALTIGTRDGATIEMAEEAGEENFFLFGLTAEEVQNKRATYRPMWHYENEPETRAALDLIFDDQFSPDERGIFAPIREVLVDRGDYYMHLADLASYTAAQQQLGNLFSDTDAWVRKAILNVAASGKFSSDRTIAEYAAEIWNALPCPIEQ